MIIAGKRGAVIKNIKKSCHKHEYNEKVEPGDSTLTAAESQKLINCFWQNKAKPRFRPLARIIRGGLGVITPLLTSDCRIEDLEKLKNYQTAFINVNHYNQLDILLIKKLAMKKKRRLYFFVEDSNLVMHFPIGFLVRNADSIPVNENLDYMGRKLPRILKKIFPDPSKSIRHNMIAMRKQDYSQKKAAYEQIYHKKLTYEFHDDDIAGWRKE